jgi:hypothetical protein
MFLNIVMATLEIAKASVYRAGGDFMALATGTSRSLIFAGCLRLLFRESCQCFKLSWELHALIRLYTGL